MYTFVYVYVYTFVCIHLYVYICMYTSVCIHLYVYICLGNLSRNESLRLTGVSKQKSDLHPVPKAALKQLFLFRILIVFRLERHIALFGIYCTPLSSWATRLYVRVCIYMRLYVRTCMGMSVCIHL